MPWASLLLRSAEDIAHCAPHPQTLGISHGFRENRALERLNHLDDILEAADGIMIARGDLGVVSADRGDSGYSKTDYAESDAMGKPVITATQMLESMTTIGGLRGLKRLMSPTPFLTATDCVMLSGESALGKVSGGIVTMLAKIAGATEPFRPHDPARETFERAGSNRGLEFADLIALSVKPTLERSSPAAFLFRPEAEQPREASPGFGFRYGMWQSVPGRETCPAPSVSLTEYIRL
jgi:pyruvate kinase